MIVLIGSSIPSNLMRRADRTRTCNLRFWRPLRYQLRHCPRVDRTKNLVCDLHQSPIIANEWALDKSEARLDAAAQPEDVLVSGLDEPTTVLLTPLSENCGLSRHIGEFLNERHKPFMVEPARRVSARLQAIRSEEHTSELQSRGHLVCR